MNERDQQRFVLITGASSGIGRASALWLDAKGIRVFAGVRNEQDGDALRQSASNGLTPVFIDVTVPSTIESARRKIADTVGRQELKGLVNNAGTVFGGPLEFSSVDEMRKQFEVNLFGAIAVTQAFLPLLRAGGGRIVNVTSISGRIALPFFGPYAASKFALEAISDSWRVELRPWDISVALVEPGLVETPIHRKVLDTLERAREAFPAEAEQLYGGIFGTTERVQQTGIPAERVARIIEHALFSRRPKHRYLVGNDAKFLAVLAKLPTRLRDWLIAKQLPKYG